MIQRIRKAAFILVILTGTAALGGPVAAQGSIYGVVTNSNATSPDSSEFEFYGFLDDTDEEIRIITCIGAGYDNGRWYDDFQNYLTEAAGNPYDYFFYNALEEEGYVLSSFIPDNSFQEENIQLAPVSWPERPAGVVARMFSASEVQVSWVPHAGITHHVYRRDASSNGSFFRIDDTTGSLANAGVIDNVYSDYSVDSGGIYDYLVIPEDESGQLGPVSAIATVAVVIEGFLRGDVNADGTINVGDCVYLINYLFKQGAEPIPLESAECNCDGFFNVGDIVYLINFLFRYGPPPQCL